MRAPFDPELVGTAGADIHREPLQKIIEDGDQVAMKITAVSEDGGSSVEYDMQAGVIMAGSQARGGVVRLAGTPQDPRVDVDSLAVQEFVDRLHKGVAVLDVGERWEGDVVR